MGFICDRRLFAGAAGPIGHPVAAHRTGIGGSNCHFSFELADRTVIDMHDFGGHDALLYGGIGMGIKERLLSPNPFVSQT